MILICYQGLKLLFHVVFLTGSYFWRTRSKSQRPTLPGRSSDFSNYHELQLSIRTDHNSELFRPPTVSPTSEKTRHKEGSVLSEKWLPLPLGRQVQAKAEVHFLVIQYGSKEQSLCNRKAVCSRIFQMIFNASTRPQITWTYIISCE